MIHFYFSPAPNPMKVALMLEETGLAYDVTPIDTRRGEQHTPAFRAVNPNGKVPAIVDTDGPAGQPATVWDSNAILLYLGEKTGQLLGTAADRPALLSWLMFVATGIGPYSGQAVHFQNAAPEPLPYAINRYRREVERHYQVLDDHLKGREFIVGAQFTLVDIAAWGWLDRAGIALKGAAAPLEAFPNVQRWFAAINARPAVARARAVGAGHTFKQEMDEAAKRAMFPSNYPAAT